MKKILVFSLSLLWMLSVPLGWAGESVFGLQKFVRQHNKPEKEVVMFEVANPTGMFWLQVSIGEAVPRVERRPGEIEAEEKEDQNEDRDNDRARERRRARRIEMINLVESGRIWLNGELVARPRDFNVERTKQFGFQKDIALDLFNTLEVELRGKPGSFINVQIREAEPNVNVSNRKGDLSGLNSGDAINLWWEDDEKAAEYLIFRGLFVEGPWEEIFRRPGPHAYNGVDLTPEARLRDLCYRIEAVDSKGRVVRRYEPICVPKFVEPQRQSFNLKNVPGPPNAIQTGKTKTDFPKQLASLSLLALASDPPINELCLTNTELTDFNSMTLDEISKFLERHGSFLRGWIDDVDGIPINPAQEIYFNAAQNRRINPKVLLTILQREQGAITATTRLRDRLLRRIMGWDVVDGQIPLEDKSIRGQIFEAASQLRRDFDRLTDVRVPPPKRSTAGGWRVGVQRKTTDGVLVTPATEVSAIMYSYNPEVGERWGGGKGVGGNSGFCYWWDQFGFKPRERLVLSPQNPTITCASTSPSITFTVTGGRPAYSWSSTNGIITPQGVNNEAAIFMPPDLGFVRYGHKLFIPPACGIVAAGVVVHDSAGAVISCNDIEPSVSDPHADCAANLFPGVIPDCGPAVCQAGNPTTESCGLPECEPNPVPEEICSALLANPSLGAILDIGCRQIQGSTTVTVKDAAGAPVSTTVTVQ